MNTEPIYVKPDDFFNYTGRNLSEELQLGDNESNQANIFLKNVEHDLMSRVDAISFRIYHWDRLSPFQLECLQEAIILQAEYVIRGGDMMGDSGYEPERGFVASMDRIQEAALSPKAKDRLIKCGLLNHVIKNRPRFTRINRY